MGRGQKSRRAQESLFQLVPEYGWTPETNPPSAEFSYSMPISTEADIRYAEDLPAGYFPINTSGEGQLCGMRAVIHTITAMHTDLIPPTVNELMTIFDSEKFQEHVAPFGLDNTNNFHVDQIAALLQFWGQKYCFEDLQLGYILHGTPHLVQHRSNGRARTVWIHHNGVNHYEGVRPRTVLSDDEWLDYWGLERTDAFLREFEESKLLDGHHQAHKL